MYDGRNVGVSAVGEFLMRYRKLGDIEHLVSIATFHPVIIHMLYLVG